MTRRFHQDISREAPIKKEKIDSIMQPLPLRKPSHGCPKRVLRGFVATFAVLALLASFGARSANAQAQQFGSVDMQKVASAYTKTSASDDQFKTFKDQLTAAFSTQAANPMLNAQQQGQLGNLLLKPNPTDADKAQIQTLESQSQKDAQALAALQQQKTLSDADKAQLAQLTGEQQSGQDALQAVQTDYQNRMQQENDKLLQQISDDIRAAVAAVAKQKGLTMVFTAEVAIYAQNDITQAVINKLNGGK